MERFDLSQITNFEKCKEIIQIIKEVNLYPLFDKLICGRITVYTKLQKELEKYIKSELTNQGKIF